jgi:inorganic phosphate transporter, PiT family
MHRPCAGGWPGHIVMAWIFTIPATALIAAVFYGLSRLLF